MRAPAAVRDLCLDMNIGTGAIQLPSQCRERLWNVQGCFALRHVHLEEGKGPQVKVDVGGCWSVADQSKATLNAHPRY